MLGALPCDIKLFPVSNYLGNISQDVDATHPGCLFFKSFLFRLFPQRTSLLLLANVVKFQPAATFFFGVMGDMASKMEMVPEDKALPGKVILCHSATFSCLEYSSNVWYGSTLLMKITCQLS